MDVLSASSQDDKIAWYENTDGLGTFGPQQVITTAADQAKSVYAADVDGDGDIDVLSASPYDDKIAWYENTDGRGTFGPQRVISNATDNAYSVHSVDVDGDGDMDVLSASYYTGVTWYENTDGQGTFGPALLITSAADGARSVFAADFDGDGDIDVLSASIYDDKIAWYENGYAGVTVSATPDLLTAEDGGQATFAISLYSEPEAPVTIGLASSDTSEGIVSPQSVTFTAADWKSPQTVTVTGVDDDLTDGDVGYTIEISASVSADPRYDGLRASNVSVINWDDDCDFGDAAAPYATLLADNGARHSATGPTLGASRDQDPDGQPTVMADGDDTDGSDDEDGVAFGSTIRVGQLEAAVTVNVQNSPDGAKLDAWIDFNGDGSWGGIGEQIADGFVVSQGDNTVEFDVPSWATSGETYARFRLSTAGNLAQAGRAGDGEIEDYLVTIEPPARGTGDFGPQQVITVDANDARSVFAADVDGDGDMDVLSASYRGFRKVAWYENTDGRGTFGPRRVIATDADGATSVFAADVDGDGDLDVFSTSSRSDDKIAWYENTDGLGTFGPQQVIATADGAYSVRAADMDGDGDMDVLLVSGSNDTIAWHENTDGQGRFGEATRITAARQARSVIAVDVDGDGDLDAISAFYKDGTDVAWYENTDGLGSFGPQQVITTAADYARSVHAADVDGDGDMDVLSASDVDDKIAWYENIDGRGTFGPQQVITTDADDAWSVFAADVDGDGDMDVLSASEDDNKIGWYENTDGLGTFSPQQVITTDAGGARSVFAADVDGDGDLDVLSASSGDDKIAWYENLGPGTQVGGRHVFYENSMFDTGDGKTDDDAIVPDKMVLLPGETATAANYTNYSRGINGIMVDIAGLAGSDNLGVDDFQFRVGNIDDPQSWQPTAVPTEVDVRLDAGVGGCDRVSLTWEQGAVTNGWLEVTMLATDNTGLTEPDTFYFGNMIGDANDDLTVDLSDFNLWNATKFTQVGLDAVTDFDRSGAVDLSDFNLWNAHKFTSLATGADPVPPAVSRRLFGRFDDPTDAIDELAWLRELDESRSNRSCDTPTLAAAAVDRLLATYWE